MLPSLADVAALTRARTQPRVGGGEDTGTFTEFTVPTDAQAQFLLDRATRAVELHVGKLDTITDASLQSSVSDLIAVRTAMEIERSYFPETVGADNGTYSALERQYREDLKALIEAMREIGQDGSANAGNAMIPLASGLDDDCGCAEPVRWW